MDEEFKIAMEDTESNFKNKMRIMFESFLGLNEIMSKSLKDYDADGYASVRSRFYNILNNVGEEGGKNVSIFQGLQRLNEVNATLLAHGFKPISIDTQTDISVGKFLVDSGFIEMTPNNIEISQINNEYLQKLATHFNFEKEQDESDETYFARILPQLQNAVSVGIYENRLIEKFEQLIPDLTSKNVLELLNFVNTSDDFTPEEKSYINNKFSPFIELVHKKELLENFIDKLESEEEELTAEDFNLIGLPVMEKGSPELAEAVQNLVTVNEQQLATLEAQKLDFSPDTELDKIHNEKQSKLATGKEIDEENRQAIIDLIDSMGMPTDQLNLGVLQEQINVFLEENKKAFEVEKQKIETTIQDPQKVLESLAAIAQIQNTLPNFRVKDIKNNADIVLNPKTALLIQYAKGVMASGDAMDNEVLIELKKEQQKLNYLVEGEDEEDPVILEVIRQIDEIDEILSYGNVKINHLYKKLREFETEMFGWDSPVSIFKILEENVDFFGNIINTAQFVRTPLQLEQMKKAMWTIDAVKAVVTAMNTTEIGPGNLYGMNVALNKMLEKQEEAPRYEVIGSEASVNIVKDLKLIEDKLKYLKLLAENNSTTIIENDAKIQKAMISGLVEQALNKNNDLSLINLKLNGKSIFSVDDLDKIEKITDQERKLIEIQHIFYINFHNAEGELTDKLDELFKDFIPTEGKKSFLEKFLGSRDSDLTAEFRKLEAFDWYRYVHYLLAYDSYNFYINYEFTIKNELSLQEQKAPLYTQQFALRQALSYYENKPVVKHLVDFIYKDIEESASLTEDMSIEDITKILKNKILDISDFPINNINSIRGSGGTGKSSVLGNWLLKILLNDEKLGKSINIIAIAPTQDTLNTLKKDLGGNINHEISNYTKEEFLNTVLEAEGIKLLKEAYEILETSNDPKVLNDTTKEKFLDPKYFVAGEGSGAILITKEFLKTFVIKRNTDIPTVVIGDEMSKFTTLEWQILNYLASPSKDSTKKYDEYYITLLGDELQNGVIIGNNNFSMDNVLSNSTVKLKNPIRSNNFLKNANNIMLENFTNE